jgi:hypothetical protein
MIGWFVFCQQIVTGGKRDAKGVSTVLSENCGKTELSWVRCTGDVHPKSQLSKMQKMKVETWDEPGNSDCENSLETVGGVAAIDLFNKFSN